MEGRWRAGGGLVIEMCVCVCVCVGVCVCVCVAVCVMRVCVCARPERSGAQVHGGVEPAVATAAPG